MYTVIGLDGVEYGPIDFQTLYIWTTQGRILPGSLVTDLTTGQRLTANQLPGLQSAFNLPPSLQTMMGQSLSRPVASSKGTIQVPPGTHSVATAVLLSFLFFVCAGQFYNRQYIKGVVLILVAMGMEVVTGGLSLLVTWPVAVVDAGCIASRLNRGEAVSEWQWF